MAFTYTANLNPTTGAFVGVNRSDGLSNPVGNADYLVFLAWNAANGNPVSLANGTPTVPYVPKAQTFFWEGTVSQAVQTLASGVRVAVGHWLAVPTAGTPTGGQAGPLTPGGSVALYSSGPNKVTLSLSANGVLTIQGTTALNVLVSLNLLLT